MAPLPSAKAAAVNATFVEDVADKYTAVQRKSGPQRCGNSPQKFRAGTGAGTRLHCNV
jgi:hypothetical protein